MNNFNFKSILKENFLTLLWGNSIGLAWVWGLGLFLAVQIAIQFGFQALISFATIDAAGLALFGIINEWMLKKHNSKIEDFEKTFLHKAGNFKLAFLFYQFLLVSLTLYCCLKYVTLPIGILSILVAAVFFGATIFLGEEFPINKIKYSHGVMGFIILTSLLVLMNSNIFDTQSIFSAVLSTSDFALKAELTLNKEYLSWLDPFWTYKPLYSFHSSALMYAFWIPILIGFLCGPWLDLQQWQRVIQIKKEKLSPAAAFIIGGIIFWLVMVVDGMLAIACFSQGAEVFNNLSQQLTSSIDPGSLLYSVKDAITNYLLLNNDKNLLGFYFLFIAFSILTTFDSAYLAYKWYAENLVRDSKSILFSFIPTKLISSPIPAFLLCTLTAIFTLHFSEIGKFIAKFDSSLERFFRIELEYYIAFYAAFFVIYAVVFFRNISSVQTEKIFSSLKLFSTALSGLAIFGIGYFAENTILMALGSSIPFFYGWSMIPKKEILINRSDSDDSRTKGETKLIPPNPEGSSSFIDLNPTNFTSVDPQNLPTGAKSVGIKGCYIKDGWFVHHFIPTYQDTNSVGNVYFAMYLMWVGKTRELFFMHTMPDFDPKNTDFFILTRSIEHKFVKEIREFDEVYIQIKIADYNRKFVTLEHQILDTKGELVGKGKQVLMFVSSKDYSLIDLPEKIQKVYINYVGEVKDVNFRN